MPYVTVPGAAHTSRDVCLDDETRAALASLHRRILCWPDLRFLHLDADGNVLDDDRPVSVCGSWH